MYQLWVAEDKLKNQDREEHDQSDIAVSTLPYFPGASQLAQRFHIIPNVIWTLQVITLKTSHYPFPSDRTLV
jgi:hypothetical protein